MENLMAKIGYARVSSTDQNLDRQLNTLKERDCEKIFMEKISGKNTNRPELKGMMDYIREGDTVFITSISRIARSTKDFLKIIEELQLKGVDLVSSKENIDTTTPQGRFMLTVFSALAELEREQIRERQQEGIAIAKQQGKHLGRPRLKRPDNFNEVYLKWKSEEITAVEAYKKLNMSKASFYRLIQSEKVRD